MEAAILALATLDGYWLWGDWSPPTMKAIDALIARGQLDEAERALAARLRWSAQDGDARMKRARLLVKRGDALGGALELHRVPAWWPARAEASFLEGQTFKLADRARDAEAAWRACLVDDPLHPPPSAIFHGAAKELVTLYVLEGRLDEARAVLWRTYDEATSAERPGVLATRMRLELERIDHAEAVDRLRAYLRADPLDHAARRALALEEHATGDEPAADRDLGTCLAALPDDPASRLAQLEILHDRGDVGGFRDALARLPASTEAEARAWMYRGVGRQRDGDPVGALGAFRRAAGLAPDDPEVLYKLGLAEVAAGLAEPGREHLARTRRLREAYEALRDGYHHFIDEFRRAPRDEAGYRAAIGRLAEACRLLGWAREADAWLAQLPGA